jgi:hypothetical protein
MKELSDDELQQWLQQQLEEDKNPELTNGEDDPALYRLLFSALADEPVIAKNKDLAEAVIKQIQAEDEKHELLQYYIIIAAVLAGGVAFAWFAVNYINPAMVKPVLNFANVYKWVIAFTIISLAAIEIADKTLVKRKIFAG